MCDVAHWREPDMHWICLGERSMEEAIMKKKSVVLEVVRVLENERWEPEEMIFPMK